MKKFTLTAVTVGALATAALGLAGSAAAAPTAGAPAADIVKQLQHDGYNVQLNGAVTGALSECTVTDVHGDTGPIDPARYNTVYLDVSCHSRIS